MRSARSNFKSRLGRRPGPGTRTCRTFPACHLFACEPQQKPPWYSRCACPARRHVQAGTAMNQEDKDRFFAGSSTWNEHFQQPGSWTTRYKADLSGQKLWEDNATGESGAEVYDDVDLSGCDLHDADFGAPGGFDLTRASFAYSNVRGCNLAGAVLTDADFTEADLTEAVLDGATLDRTNLATTTLTGAVLARSRPWRARLFQPPAHAPTPPVTTNTIGSVGDLVGEHSPLVGGRAKNSTATLYYRGESQRFALAARPVMRRRVPQGPGGSYVARSLMTRLPEAFEGASGPALATRWYWRNDAWTRAHDSLDVTRNCPLWVGPLFRV